MPKNETRIFPSGIGVSFGGLRVVLPVLLEPDACQVTLTFPVTEPPCASVKVAIKVQVPEK